MDRASSYKKVKAEKKVNRDLENVAQIISDLDLKLICACIIGFLISRVTMLYMMSSASISYLSLFAFTGNRYYGVLISVVLGIVSIGNKTETLKYILAVAVVTVLNFWIGQKKDKLSIQAITASVAVLIAGIAKSLMVGISLYFIFMAILESILVFTLTFVFDKAVSRIMDDFPKKYFTNEELISMAILAGGAIVGIGNIHFGNVYIRDILVIFMIMTVGYRGGAVAGTSSAITLGLFMLLSNNFTAQQAVMISGAGLVCGLMQELGKIGSGIGFIMGGILLSVYMNNSIVDKRIAISSIIVFAAFIIIPNKFYDRLKTVINFDSNLEDKQYIAKVQDITSERLKSFSAAFDKLSETFSNLSEKRTSLTQKEISRLFDDVAAKVCNNCGMSTYCWEDYFYDTYQTMFSILAAAEKKGHIDESDIPFEFKGKCTKLSEFVFTTNRMFELYKNNLIWYNRIIESRKLISEQLNSVSNVIGNLSNDIKLELNFKDDIGKSVQAELIKNNIDVLRVIVLENKYGKYELNISLKPCYGRRMCSREIIPVVNKALNKKMKSKNVGCNISKEEKICNLRLIEEPKFRVVSGIARASKDESQISGDSYTFMELRDSQCLMALSDGMGSGIRANRESTASIELLEEFLDSGFDRDTTVKVINSVLVLKSNEESFSTLDMCIINMYSGICEFIKIGAAATYIKRGSTVEIIHSTSLPVGMLDKVDIESTKKKLKDNDLIVMITDGVIDSVGETDEKKIWIENLLKNYRGNNPQDIADFILEEAKNNMGGNIDDDMTVLVARVWDKK